jgi:hypothetical protein
MKYLAYLLIVPSIILANEWELKNVMLTTENDADFRTDRDYTYGSKIAMLYEREKNDYISFGIAHQMFTPEDFDKEGADLTDQRPYAGYMYLDMGLHTIESHTLSSWNFQLGIVGPAAQMDKVQEIIHDIIGSPDPLGWEEQINNEVIVQINYEKRWLQKLDDTMSMVYYAGGNLGNASIKGVGGAVFQKVWNMPQTFAPRRIDYRGYPDIPLQGYSTYTTNHGFGVGAWVEGNIVGRDIFLDGNTFVDSISVDKEIFVAKGGFHLAYRYKNLSVTYFKTFSTKEFTTQTYYHNYGSLIFLYNF